MINVTPLAPLSLLSAPSWQPFRSVRERVTSQFLDPGSTTNILLGHASSLMPWAIAVAGQCFGVAALFSKQSPLMIGMTRRKEPGGAGLSDSEFEEAWLNGLSLSPELADGGDVREIESRMEKKAARGESTSRLWKVLSEIAGATESKPIRTLALAICERRQQLFEAGLENLTTQRVTGNRRSLWRGLRNSLERKEYDHAVDFICALLREDNGRVNHRLIQYPHPMVRSFVYSFLVAFGHHEKVRAFWQEFESTLFREDIETTDSEIRRFTINIAGTVLAAGTQQELAYILFLHAVLQNGTPSEIRRAERTIAASPSGREGTALSCLLFCLLNPEDAELRFLARGVLNRLVDRLEVKGKK